MKTLLFLLLLLFGPAIHPSDIDAAELVLVSSPDRQGIALSKKEVADIYSGKTSKWPDGTRITPVYLKGAVHEDFLSTFVGKNSAQFTATWKKLVFTGKASMPDECESEADLINKIKSTPGSLGYISKTTSTDGVIVIPLK